MIIGVTGGIGAGKSEVANILSALNGYPVSNADQLAHQIYASGTEAWEKIIHSFGSGILDSHGQIDRRLLGAIVFSDPEKLRILEGIVHPPLIALLRKRVAVAREKGQGLIVDAALIYELDLAGLFDQVWVVTATPETVLQRVACRSSLDAGATQKRILAQLDPDEKAVRATVVIPNNQDMPHLTLLVEKAWLNAAEYSGNESRNA